MSKKSDLARLKSNVDKLDIDKFVPVSVDLSKLSDLVKHDVAKKTVHNKLVAKVNNIDTSVFVSKTKYNTVKSNIQKKKSVMLIKIFLMIVDLFKKTHYNAKITEIEVKIPSISSLANKSAYTEFENKINDLSVLVKK